MLRIDRSVTPTMARTPTLAHVGARPAALIANVVRHGHLTAVARGRLEFADGSVAVVADDALVVHCAARACGTRRSCRSGGRRRSRCSRSASGFPCFGAALVGYVEATRDDDAEKNRLCPPSPYADSMATGRG